MTPSAAITRMSLVSAEIEITRARLRGDMEILFALGGLAGLDSAIQHERQRITAANRERLAQQGFVA